MKSQSSTKDCILKECQMPLWKTAQVWFNPEKFIWVIKKEMECYKSIISL